MRYVKGQSFGNGIEVYNFSDVHMDIESSADSRVRFASIGSAIVDKLRTFDVQ